MRIPVEKWFWPLRQLSAESVGTLLIFPHAGGSAQSYASWGDWLPRQLSVLVAQYPGRGARFDEPSADSIESLAEALADAAIKIPSPLFVFGHSLGGVIGFEMACRLQQQGCHLAGFMPSAAVPPHLFRRSLSPGKPLTDEQLLVQLHERGGLPADISEHPDLLEMLFEVLREDIRILGAYEMVDPTKRLACPVVVFGGEDDLVSTPSRVVRWQECVSSPIQVHILPGGHFYFIDDIAALVSPFCAAIGRWTGKPVAPSFGQSQLALS
jgi:surfactin synthase thioesterase subunit